MARTYGIEGFCYYHYWFAGRRLLERPFNEVLHSGGPDFPFCLCWANETWTGVWHGCPHRVLMAQEYPGARDEAMHFRFLLEAFTDDRYMCVDGKPIFVIYSPKQLPEARRTTDHWRQLAQAAGLKGLYLVGHENEPWNPEAHGFDAAVVRNLPNVYRGLGLHPNRLTRYYRRLRSQPMRLYRYADAIRFLGMSEVKKDNVFPCLVLGQHAAQWSERGRPPRFDSEVVPPTRDCGFGAGATQTARAEHRFHQVME
jgi:hypothetical protein